MASKKYSEIEQREGKPMSEILIGLFNLYGDAPNSQEVIADKLGISQPTLSQWIKFLRLKPKTMLIPPEGSNKEPITS